MQAVNDEVTNTYCGIQTFDAKKCALVTMLTRYYEDKAFSFFAPGAPGTMLQHQYQQHRQR
jgi:hypothetical protein